jgi:hypothetical protein
MPWNVDPAVHALRLGYNAAASAHLNSARALGKPLCGDTPTSELLEAEAQARERLEEARAKLHAAIARPLDPPNDERTRECAYIPGRLHRSSLFRHERWL